MSTVNEAVLLIVKIVKVQPVSLSECLPCRELQIKLFLEIKSQKLIIMC